MIAIIDYGIGNLFSLKSSLLAIGAEAFVSRDPAEIEKAEKIILPGVGAFGDAAKKLSDCGMDTVLLREAEKGKPILGICLGMQLLFEKSFEYGEHRGLGLLKGEIRPIGERIPKGLKIPHIGWNALDFTEKPSKLFRFIANGDHVYFVHSFAAERCEDSVIATAEYGVPLAAAVEKDNIFGCQFHPEKSGDVGLSILRGFCETEGAPC